MPELPDVEGFCRVAERCARQQVEQVQINDAGVLRGVSAKQFRDALRERYFDKPRRYGKWLLIPTSAKPGGGEDMPCLLLHFGMTGMLEWCSPDDESHPHDRVVFRFGKGELRYRDMRKLKGIRLAQDKSEIDEVLDELGPDALEVSAGEFRQRLSRTRRQIKPALMDQAVLSGLGNICVDEILWRANIHPHRATSDFTSAQWTQTHRRMLSMLRQAIRVGRVPDYASWLTGHRDEPDGKCPRCSTPLRRDRVGGRSTIWCPRCQK